ncbi:MAG: putative DNA modification/repair radical SAM protein [Thermodesulfovibrionales bacterium]
MDTIEKLKVLSEDSRYDLACACGTAGEDHRRRGAEGRWLYPVALPNGGYSVLLKTLLSNACANDCGYCPLRSDTDVRRCTLAPEEVARVFMEYWRRRKVFGLFLSSAVMGTPDRTMDRINAVARLLRRRHGFRGYIHLKIIPGASDAAVEESLSLASAVSLNIEAPGKSHFDKLTRRKDFEADVLRPIRLMGRLTARGSRYPRVKCTTQFIVGASDERDSEIVDSLYGLYGRLNFKRVYFSAYQKGLGRPDIPGERRFLSNPNEAFMREHRLYQADFLARKYGFGRDDIIFDPNGYLRLDKDPKEVWADAHPERYPVKLNSGDREALLRVPGLGPETVDRILDARRQRRLSGLERLGVKGKRLQKVMRYAVFE